jgi:hypothetical protein
VTGHPCAAPVQHTLNRAAQAGVSQALTFLSPVQLCSTTSMKEQEHGD